MNLSNNLILETRAALMCALVLILLQQLELTSTPLDCVRLVKYDNINEYIDRSFENEEDVPIHQVLGGVKSIYSFDLLLEVKMPDEEFQSYIPGG